MDLTVTLNDDQLEAIAHRVAELLGGRAPSVECAVAVFRRSSIARRSSRSDRLRMAPKYLLVGHFL
jgi:hypothetical protein